MRVERRVEKALRPLKWTTKNIMRQRRADPSRKATSQNFSGATL
jgi:hypothetical protein